MGIRIIPREFANDCIACWDAGETPAFIYVAFLDVLPGDIPGSVSIANAFWFKCIQNEASPCDFWYNRAGPGTIVEINRSIATGRWHVNASVDAKSVFTGWVPGCPTEKSVWTNLQNNPAAFFGWAGFAYCFWMETATELLVGLNLPDNGDTFLEVFVKDDTKLVYKFCNVKYRMNQLIELS